MATTTTTPNMNMPLPVVGVDPGPTYGTDQNTCFTIVDAHDHSIGNGVKITPNGLNINTDLSFITTSSATNLYSARFTSQASPLTGTNFISFSGGNLYVNDSSGNQIQITSGGGVAGSPGSIGSLTAPASATYSAGSKLFTWQAGVNKSAAMDNGAVTIRETNVTSAKGITLASPTALGADYQLTFPSALPGSTQYLSCDASGNLGTVSANTIGLAMTATAANSIANVRTRATSSAGADPGLGGISISSSSGNYSTTNLSQTVVLSTILTVSGRPISIGLRSDGSSATFGCSHSSATFMSMFIAFGDNTGLLSYSLSSVFTQGASANQNHLIPASSFNSILTGFSAGTYTFSVDIYAGESGTTAYLKNAELVVYEL